MSRLAGVLLPHKQMPSRRSKNVVQVTANPAKLETKSEKKGDKRFASICHNLPFPSGLRRLRQDLVNLVPRLEGRCSIHLSYGRAAEVSLILKHLMPFQKLNPPCFSLYCARTVPKPPLAGRFWHSVPVISLALGMADRTKKPR